MSFRTIVTLIWTTIGYGLAVGLFFLVNLERIFEDLTLAKFFLLGVLVVIGYIAVLCKFTALGDQKLFQKFFLIYNIAFPLMAVTLLIRGIVQVTGYPMTRMLNGMLSGFAGLSHIFLAVALFLLLLAVKRELCNESAK